MKRNNEKRKVNNKTFKPYSLIGCGIIVTLLVTTSIFLFPASSSAALNPQTVNFPPQFNLNVAYAFVGYDNGNTSYVDSNGLILHQESQYPSAVYFNVTRSNSQTLPFDAIIELYSVEIATDKGPAEKYVYFDGTNFKPSFKDAELTTLTDSIYNLIDNAVVDGVSGNFCFNLTDGSVLSQKVGSCGSYSNYKQGLGLWSAGQPSVISVSVHRIGCVTMTSGSVSSLVDSVNIGITQIQLQKEGNGFITNNLVSPDKLSQINLFHPLG